MSVYRKRGSVVRYEHGVIVRVEEAGEAREIGGEFLAEPSGAPPLEAPSTDAILAFVRELFPNVECIVECIVERIVVSEGIAEHEYGPHRWGETSRRVHLSLTHGPFRALLDLAAFDVDAVASVARALAGLSGERTPERVRLAPNVAAALLPSLIGRIELEQLPAGHDGYGEPVERRRVEGPPPNWYRPSYRLRPVPAWHNLRALPFGAIDRGDARVPLAVALLAPPETSALRLLCTQAGDAFAAAVPLTSIRAVGETEAWYPYAAGAFGAEMLL
jgi:hypothetical protein